MWPESAVSVVGAGANAAPGASSLSPSSSSSESPALPSGRAAVSRGVFGVMLAHSGRWSSETAGTLRSAAVHRSETASLDGTSADDWPIDSTPQHTAIADRNDDSSVERQLRKGVCT